MNQTKHPIPDAVLVQLLKNATTMIARGDLNVMAALRERSFGLLQGLAVANELADAEGNFSFDLTTREIWGPETKG